MPSKGRDLFSLRIWGHQISFIALRITRSSRKTYDAYIPLNVSMRRDKQGWKFKWFFLDTASYIFIEDNGRFRGNKYLWNDGKIEQDYKA
jgi:hypothetical protein